MTKKLFYSELNGLRGILALAVAFSHSLIWLTVGGNKSFYQFPILAELHSLKEYLFRIIMFFAIGPATVYLFFVISGFVLGYVLIEKESTKQGTIIPLFGYLTIQRFFRLIPLNILLISIIAVIMQYASNSKNPLASDWYKEFYTAAPHLKEYLLNLVFLSKTLNPVTWSLFHETWILIPIMPFFVWISRNIKISYCWMLVFIFYFLGQVTQLYFHFSSFPYGMNGAFIFLFYAGFLLYYQKDKLVKLKLFHPLVYWAAIPVVRLFSNNISIIIAWEGGCSILLIAALLTLPSHTKISLFLNHRFLQGMGKRSYGFYLAHQPVLYLIATLLLNYLPPSFLQRYSITVSLLSAGISILFTVLLTYFLLYPFEKFWINLRYTIEAMLPRSYKVSPYREESYAQNNQPSSF